MKPFSLTNIFLHEVAIDANRFNVETFQQQGYAIPETIQRSVAKRQAEFLAGRFVANEALKAAGCDYAINQAPSFLPIGEKRAPIWPQGFVGSITHSNAKAKAIVSSTEYYQSLGMDCELWMDSKRLEDIGKYILLENEQTLLKSLAENNIYGFNYAQLVTLAFSAKESVFKALYPFVKEYFGFECAAITSISPDQTIQIQLTQDLCPQFKKHHQLLACFEYSDDDVTTVIAIKNN